MSREHTIRTASVALNRILSQEGVETRFDAHELELLREYQNIKSHPYWQFRLNCAAMAAEELRQGAYRTVSLTEFGVAVEFEREYDHSTRFLERSVEATKDFLHIWERIRNEQAANQPALAQLTAETKAMVDQTFLKPLLTEVVQQMRRQGFSLENSDDLNQPASQMLVNGLQLHFTKPDGTRQDMTFFLPGGQLAMTDFHAAPGAELMCGGGAEECLNLVMDSVRKMSRALGVPMGVTADAGPVDLTGADDDGNPRSGAADPNSNSAQA